MSVDLTDDQKALIRWLVQEIGTGRLAQEFYVVWAFGGGGTLSRIEFIGDSHPPITEPTLAALERAGLLVCTPNIKRTTSIAKKYRKLSYPERETHRRCALTRQAYEIVAANFNLSADRMESSG